MGANARRRHGTKERVEKVPTPLFPKVVWRVVNGVPSMGISNRSRRRIEARNTPGPVRSAHDRARSAEEA